jgi:hypothetical protein
MRILFCLCLDIFFVDLWMKEQLFIFFIINLVYKLESFQFFIVNFFMKFHSFHEIFALLPSCLWIFIIHLFVTSLDEALYDLFLFWIIIYRTMIIFFELLNGLSVIEMIKLIETYLVTLEQLY